MGCNLASSAGTGQFLIQVWPRPFMRSWSTFHELALLENFCLRSSCSHWAALLISVFCCWGKSSGLNTKMQWRGFDQPPWMWMVKSAQFFKIKCMASLTHISAFHLFWIEQIGVETLWGFYFHFNCSNFLRVQEVIRKLPNRIKKNFYW